MFQSNPDAEQGKPVVIIAGTSVSGRRRSGCGCLGLVIGLVIALATLAGIGVAVLAVAAPNILNNLIGSITGAQMPQSKPVPGAASSFDPVSTFEAVRQFAGENAQLISLRASNVRSDGTLDLTATYSPGPRVDYRFAREIPRPADAPPVGAGGTGTGPWYEPITVEAYQPGQRRQVTTIGGGVKTSYQYVNEGMTRTVSSASTSLGGTLVDAPTCPFKDLWQTVLEANSKAQKDAVASITYDSDGYDFVISGLGVSLHFDMACRLKK
jgi:hypothetical protein